MSMPLVRYVLMAALRDRLLLSLILVFVLGGALALFLGSSAVVEPEQFSIVLAGGGLRFAGVVGLTLFIVFHMRRSFDNKDVEFLLSRPITRMGFILSHAVAFSILAIVLALAAGVSVCAMSFHHLGAGQGLWVFSLVMEYMIVANVALFFSMVVTSATGGAMAVFGLYVLGRLMGELLGDARASNGLAFSHVLSPVMNVVSMIVPRIDLFAQTSWLVYPDAATSVGYALIAVQGLFFSGLAVCAALVDLHRRQF